MPEAFSWGTFSAGFVDELAAWIGDRKVLEVFAGNGLLASKLMAKGVDIIPTTLLRGHDGHDRGMFCDVVEMEASRAVREYGAGRDVLLMAWPTADMAAFMASATWGGDRPIVFIGEVTDYDKNHLGGCASDEFFAATVETDRFGTYSGRSFLERAAVRKVDMSLVPRLLANYRQSFMVEALTRSEIEMIMASKVVSDRPYDLEDIPDASPPGMSR